ncbi:MAG: hypothetical protein WCX65_09750 [bacterium]
MKKGFILMLCISLLAICGACSGRKASETIHPAKKFESYIFDPNKPLAGRVETAPDFVLDYLSEFDSDYLKKSNLKYTPYTPTATELAEVKKYINELPKGFAGKIAPKLLGIYFVNNLLGSGLTDWVAGEENETYFFMVFNPDVLKIDASEWITDKERSCFKADPAYNLEINIGSGTSGFYYIFYHEIAHGYDYVEHVTPGEPGLDAEKKYVELKKKSPNMVSAYPFIDRIWNEYRKPAAAYDYSGRDKITFYGINDGPKLNMSEAPELYTRMLESPFVSLYGSMSWMEDFAEYSAMYMSVKKLNRPWALTIKKDGKTVFEMKDILDRENISDRFSYIENVLK